MLSGTAAAAAGERGGGDATAAGVGERGNAMHRRGCCGCSLPEPTRYFDLSSERASATQIAGGPRRWCCRCHAAESSWQLNRRSQSTGRVLGWVRLTGEATYSRPLAHSTGGLRQAVAVPAGGLNGVATASSPRPCKGPRSASGRGRSSANSQFGPRAVPAC